MVFFYPPLYIFVIVLQYCAILNIQQVFLFKFKGFFKKKKTNEKTGCFKEIFYIVPLQANIIYTYKSLNILLNGNIELIIKWVTCESKIKTHNSIWTQKKLMWNWSKKNGKFLPILITLLDVWMLLLSKWWWNINIDVWYVMWLWYLLLANVHIHLLMHRWWRYMMHMGMMGCMWMCMMHRKLCIFLFSVDNDNYSLIFNQSIRGTKTGDRTTWKSRL